MTITTTSQPTPLKKAGFLYDQAGTGGRDVVFADDALAAIQNEQARTHWATQDRNEMLRQRDAARNDADALREKLASTPTISDKLRTARDLAETRLVEIRDLQQQLQLAKGLAHDRLEQVQAMHAGDQFRKAEDRSQALAYAVSDMQEAVHELANLLTLHRRAMDTSLAGGLERILGRLTVTIRQATK